MDRSRITEALEALQAAQAREGHPSFFAGADGFIDEIIDVVDRRYSATEYDAIRTIGVYAQRVASAAGKSTNLEWVVRETKSGGNGPLMCEALGRLGCRGVYTGSVGKPEVHPVFAPLGTYAELRSIAPVARTLATEFHDGKIMHGLHAPLKDVTWTNFLEAMGGEEGVDAALTAADCVALVNWTMLPYLNEIFEGVLGRLATGGVRLPRLFFFDLCDPAKRTRDDLREALGLIARFSETGALAILGLNEKESEEVCAVYRLGAGSAEAASLVHRARVLAEKIGVTEVVIHPTGSAAAWSARDGEGSTPGPLCSEPRLTTGAGDHFNGGYVYARALGLEPALALIIGKCVSGFYVRQGRGPSLEELAVFAGRWTDGVLDPWEDMADSPATHPQGAPEP